MESEGSTVTPTFDDVTVEGEVALLLVPVSVKTAYIPVSALLSLAVAVALVPESPDIAPLESYHCHE
jgi:hypothetical protein